MKKFSGPESRISILIFPRFNLERQLYSLLMVIKSPFLLKQKTCPDPGASNFNSKYKQIYYYPPVVPGLAGQPTQPEYLTPLLCLKIFY